MSERAPAPLDTDHYALNPDLSIRGTTVHSGRFLDISDRNVHQTSKVSHLFDDRCIAPRVPSDPLYVLPRTKFTVKFESSAGLGNAIIVGLKSLCPAIAELKLDATRMKISVLIPGTLDLKVKIFEELEHSGVYMVVCRRDSGDWFVLMQVFSAIKKYLRSHGMHVECHF